MTERLIQTLLSERLVGADVLEEAQRRQVVYEGSLDTNLLELGSVTEPEILRALGEAYHLPVGEKTDVDTVLAHMPRIFPLQFAESYRMVPFRLVGPNLGVLINSEPDRDLLNKIGERLQLRVNPTVTTEARLHYAMHRLYATRLLPRFESLLTRLDGAKPERLHGAPDEEHALSWGLPTAKPERKSAPKAKKSAPDIAALLTRLDTAPDRDAVIEILLEIAYGVFDFVCIFVVQGEQINGWRGVDSESTSRVANISLPVTNPTVFQTIYATQGHYLGPLPDDEPNQEFLAMLGRSAPRTALLAPIMVRGKLVAVTYADNGSRPVPSRRVSGLLLLAHRVGMCLENLIRRRKREQQEQTPTASAATSSVQAPSVTLPAPREADAPESPPMQEPELLSEDEFEVIVDDVDIETLPPTGSVAAGFAAQHNTGTSDEDDDEDWGEVEVEWEDALSAAGDETEVEIDDGYVAFADVGDTPEESLADWEDVLVEAAAASVESEHAHEGLSVATAPPSVGWHDVIAAAASAPSLSNGHAPAPIEVAGTQIDPTELLFDTLAAKDATTRRGAVERLLEMGPAIDAQLQERFPGSLDIDPFDADTRLTSFEALGGMCELLARRGASAGAFVAPFLESKDREQRFVATYFFLAIRYPASIESIARRLYDVEPRIRFLAADALRVYAGEEHYARVLQSLREQLKVPVLETQVTTVQVLGQLRDPRAVPSIIPLVVSQQPKLQQAAVSALAVICAQGFDQDVNRWADWWRANYSKPREVWLVGSLRHANPRIQSIAFAELQLMTGYSGAFDPSASETEKEPVIQTWENWLAELNQARTAAASSAVVEM